MATTDATSTVGSHVEELRIAPQTRMQPFVAYVLKKLEENEDAIIALHTLPAKSKPPAEGGSGEVETLTASKLHGTTKNIPRLISMVEIIKREFLKALAAKHSTRLAGLHHYNEFGCLEDLGYSAETGVPEKDRATAIAEALSGKNHVSQHQTPYLKITLSHRAHPELIERGATYQKPAIRILSKSAKQRHKKRELAAKKRNGGTDAESEASTAAHNNAQAGQA